MSRNTARALLLTSASVLTMAAFGAQAQTVVPGGGSSLVGVDYAGPNAVINAVPTAPSEEFTFNTANPQFQVQYFYASSGRGQAAFSGDNPSALMYTGSTPLPTFIAYGASDAFLAGASGTTINGYTYTTVAGIPGLTADYPLRKSQDGALVQVPMLGLGIVITGLPGVSANKANGTLHVTDDDICGIFSGKITNYANISNPLPGVSGPITVYYRADSSGTSFQFTNHLHAVCTSTNSSFPATGLAAVPSTTFTNIFTGGTVPSNFKGETGNSGVSTALAGTVTTKGGTTVGQPGDPTGISYLSTDFTDISATGAANATAAPAPTPGFINTASLFAAGVQGITAKGTTAFITPTTKNILLGLSHAGAGSTHPKPPTGAAATNPLNWVPSLPVVTEGYPIVGYTNLELAQCYASSAVESGMTGFLSAHFGGTSAYLSTISANGFTLPSKAIRKAVTSTFLTPGGSLAIAVKGTAGTCASVTGR